MSKSEEKHTDCVLPVTWEGWDEVEMLSVNLYKVTFLAEFGVFSKGEECETLTVDYQKGTLIEYSSNGIEVKSQRFEARSK